MIHLLDSDTCIRYLSRRSLAIKTRLDAADHRLVKLCSVVKAELLWGAYKSQNRVDTTQRLADFFSEFESLAFDDSAAEAYGRIRGELEKRGTPIGANDLLIAAIAIANNATLVTNNTREFSRVPGLHWESWEPAIM